MKQAYVTLIEQYTAQFRFALPFLRSMLLNFYFISQF